MAFRRRRMAALRRKKWKRLRERTRATRKILRMASTNRAVCLGFPMDAKKCGRKKEDTDEDNHPFPELISCSRSPDLDSDFDAASIGQPDHGARASSGAGNGYNECDNGDTDPGDSYDESESDLERTGGVSLLDFAGLQAQLPMELGFQDNSGDISDDTDIHSPDSSSGATRRAVQSANMPGEEPFQSNTASDPGSSTSDSSSRSGEVQFILYNFTSPANRRNWQKDKRQELDHKERTIRKLQAHQFRAPDWTWMQMQLERATRRRVHDDSQPGSARLQRQRALMAAAPLSSPFFGLDDEPGGNNDMNVNLVFSLDDPRSLRSTIRLWWNGS
ncbi:uncharacterized protein SPSK_02646 [Sporothrix schenckii 1099-18]|uniref:Uncharacterized protein n=1 Tax=Sporothrix schenckii 1099-18 TaxID=1397361 RepID=A0A0F2MBU3_SPOSC|nr:uncharacterized protein SPSK_02646 [Sporothrix schenckii 1099-18]KJR86310.1 hypothetical protein SPSK_02646 [Sporothrix schenckii 1099-18]